MESLNKLEDDRKCWRLINGILFEKTKKEVIPELKAMVQNLHQVAKQINQTLIAMRQESMQMEQAYDSIMKQARKRKDTDMQQSEAKAGGVLV